MFKWFNGACIALAVEIGLWLLALGVE